jgi:hypothetical protein
MRWAIVSILVLAAVCVRIADGAMINQRPATLTTFAGGWQGHDRGLHINRWGRGFEQINSGCCCPCFGMAFQLSHVRGTNDFAAATMTVVRLYGTTKGESAPSPPLHVGQFGSIQFRDDQIIDGLTGINYCGLRAEGAGKCGA